MLTDFGNFLSTHRLGDITSVLGLFVALIGFAVTVFNVIRSKEAARRAETAALRLRDSLRRFDTVADFAAAISILEEIRRLHRQHAWTVMPDRYSALRKHLISIRAANPNLSADHQTVIQGALQALISIEAFVEKNTAVDAKSEPDAAKLNRIMSKQVDALHEVLVALRQQIAR